MSDYPIVHFTNKEAWKTWLAKEFDKTPGIWMKFAKKGTGAVSVNYPEAIEIALCYGWIDGQGKKLDDTFWLVKFTPRGKKSIWSKVNRERVEKLIKEKRMQLPGLEKITAAKADGRWDQAFDSPKNMEIPEDFLALLKKDTQAYSFYQTLNRANMYAIAWRLQTAKKPETREKRMHVILEMMAKGEKFH